MLEIKNTSNTLENYEEKLSMQIDRSKSIFILPNIKGNDYYFSKNFAEFKDILNINCPNDFIVLSSGEIHILSLHDKTHILPTILCIVGTISVNILSSAIYDYIKTYNLRPNAIIELEIIAKNETTEKHIKYKGDVKNMEQVFIETKKLL